MPLDRNSSSRAAERVDQIGRVDPVAGRCGRGNPARCRPPPARATERAACHSGLREASTTGRWLGAFVRRVFVTCNASSFGFSSTCSASSKSSSCSSTAPASTSSLDGAAALPGAPMIPSPSKSMPVASSIPWYHEGSDAMVAHTFFRPEVLKRLELARCGLRRRFAPPAPRARVRGAGVCPLRLIAWSCKLPASRRRGARPLGLGIRPRPRHGATPYYGAKSGSSRGEWIGPSRGRWRCRPLVAERFTKCRSSQKLKPVPLYARRCSRGLQIRTT